MNRPQSVNLFAWFYGAAMCVAIASATLNIITAPPAYSRPVMFGGGIVMLSLLCLLGYKVFMGRKWARRLLSLMLVVGIASMAGSHPPELHHPFVAYLHWINTALQVIAVALLYRGESREWFTMVA